MARGKFEYRDGIAIIQVVAFSVFLLFALHFRRAQKNGWFCIGVFSLFRVIGGSCMLALISHRSNSLWAAVFVCEAVGILLMIFLLLELLERVNHFVQVVHRRIFLLPQIITLADLGISIGGLIALRNREDPLAPTPYSQAGTGLTAFIYLWMVGIFAALWLRRSELPLDEKRTMNSAAASIPFLAVRVIYSLIFVITADKTFNAIVGNPTIYLLLTTLPEISVIGICTWTITRLPPPPATTKNGDREPAGCAVGVCT